MARLACWVPAAQRSPRVLLARIPKIALLDGVVTRIAWTAPPPALYRFGESSGWPPRAVEVEESSGREGCEGELIVVFEKNRWRPPPVLYRFGDHPGLLGTLDGR